MTGKCVNYIEYVSILTRSGELNCLSFQEAGLPVTPSSCGLLMLIHSFSFHIISYHCEWLFLLPTIALEMGDDDDDDYVMAITCCWHIFI